MKKGLAEKLILFLLFVVWLSAFALII